MLNNVVAPLTEHPRSWAVRAAYNCAFVQLPFLFGIGQRLPRTHRPPTVSQGVEYVFGGGEAGLVGKIAKPRPSSAGHSRLRSPGLLGSCSPNSP
jgi:hypothetical protein